MHWNTFEIMLNFIQELYTISYIMLFEIQLLLIKIALQNLKQSQINFCFQLLDNTSFEVSYVKSLRVFKILLFLETV